MVTRKLRNGIGVVITQKPKALVENYRFDKKSTFDFGKEKYYKWGENNDLPNVLNSLVLGNALLPGIIDFKRRVVISNGIKPFIKRPVLNSSGELEKVEKIQIINNEIDDWLERIGAAEYLEKASTDIEILRNSFTEIKTNLGAKKIASIKHIDAAYCRVNKNEVIIFPTTDINSNTIYNQEAIKAKFFDAKNPTAGTYAIHSKNYFSGSAYGIPPWIGAKNWIEIQNQVAIFKLSTLRQGYSIKYHVQIPADYIKRMWDLSKASAFLNKDLTPQEYNNFLLEKEEELYDDIEKFLSGAVNAHKTLISSRSLAQGVGGTFVDEWKVEAIEDAINYKAYLDDVNTSSSMITSALSINPSLANIIIDNKNSSGSDLRNSYNIYVNTMTTESRYLLLKPINEAFKYEFGKRLSNSPIELGFENMELTTLDQVKSGTIQNQPS